MFLKPFRTKSSKLLRGSERKKLKESIISCFRLLPEEDVVKILPDKEEISSIRIITSKDINVLVYLYNKQPILFEVEKYLYPTVYTAWQLPAVVMAMSTHPPVFKKMCGGADLMLPGVHCIEPNAVEFDVDVACLVNLNDNRAAVAVGKTAISSTQITETGMRGKGVIILHTYGDCLW